MRTARAIAIFVSCLSITTARAGDFADVAIAFLPAPGQRINDAAFSDPARALGPPAGSGASAPNNVSVVTLGGFGGSIVLGFSETVWDDPCNPMGLDAIVFGNAFFQSSDATRRWAEGGVVEISRDQNGNGIADDAWFPVVGSPEVIDHIDSFRCQMWDDNAGTSTPPANVAWYPSPGNYPGIGSMYETCGYELSGAFAATIVVHPAGMSATHEVHFGIADFTPTLLLGDLDGDDVIDDPAMFLEDFYTVPDSPFLVGITPGSGGGDAFDIAWAIDPMTQRPAGLDGFDFIRISTGVDHIAGVFGEISTEVDAVSDVRPTPERFDLDGDGDVSVEDLYAWHDLAASGDPEADLSGDAMIGERDRVLQRNCVRRDEIAELVR